MSGRRMKALRREAYGDKATNAASRQYDAPVREGLVSVVTRIGKRAAELIGYRRVRVIGAGRTIRVKGPEAQRYRELKAALRRRRLGGRLPE